MTAVPIQLPFAPVRERGLLAQAAPMIDAGAFSGTDMSGERWVRDGVVWYPQMFRRAKPSEVNPVEFDKQPDPIVAPVEHQAFLLWDSLSESKLVNVREWMESTLDYTLTSIVSAALAAQLDNGTPVSGGHSLQGSVEYPPTVVTGAASPLAYALVELEQYLADTLHGAAGMIHMTPQLLVYAHAADLVYWDGSVYRTPTGHVVVGDPGHTGVDQPVGGWPASLTDEAWIYATSQVHWLVSGVKDYRAASVSPDDHDFFRNVERPLKERHAILVFDPNVVAAASVDQTVDAPVWGS